jgi:uncharacterized protein (TIGR02246 family)
MLRKSCFPLLLLSLIVVACQSTGEQTEFVSSEADAEAITELVRRYDDSVNSVDMDGFEAIFTRDAVQMPPAMQEVKGAPAIRLRLEAFLKENDDELRTEVREIDFARDRAIVRVTYVETWTPRAGGNTVQVKGKGFQFVQRLTDGTWRIAREIWNEDAPRNRS